MMFVDLRHKGRALSPFKQFGMFVTTFALQRYVSHSRFCRYALTPPHWHALC
jgi:hypothetical protein